MKKPWENTQSAARSALKATKKQVEHGLDLHRDLLVCDAFGFDPKLYTPRVIRSYNRMVAQGASAQDLKSAWGDLWAKEVVEDRKTQETYLRLFRVAGVDCLVQNVGAKGENIPYMTRTLARNAYKQDGLKRHVTKAVTADDVREARAAGRLSIVWSTNGVPTLGEWTDFEKEFLWIEVFRRLGVRMMHLTYNRRNHIADGCTETHDAGLSDYGRDVVQRMNEIGVIVDTAHTGPRSTLDAARCSSKPIVASHTGCDALFHHDRNKTDKEIRAIARTGGLIGIYTLPAFLGKKANLCTMLDHIEHVTKLVGVDHVAIATDNCYVGPKPKSPKEKPGPKGPPDDLSHWRPEHRTYASDEHTSGSLAWLNWPYFTVGLVTRGYTDRDIEKILGLNFLRVFGACCGGA